MLNVENLSKVYRAKDGSFAGGIENANFELAPGAFFTLLGPSGCGKTTTLRCIAGLNDPDEGRIAIGDKALFDSKAKHNTELHKRNIGMVFQSYAIWPHMNVGQNVGFPMQVSKSPRYSKAQIEDAVKVALKSVGMEGFEDRPATQLSGGQQQRVAFARAIVHRPQLLLLDEPLSNLDASLREDMRLELKRLQQETGITAVYVTHDQSEALSMSDNIAVINRGKIVQMGTPQDIYFRPQNEFVAGFIGHTNVITAKTTAATAKGAQGAVELGEGKTIVCQFNHKMSANSQIAISVRPENIVLRTKTAGAMDGSQNEVAAKVVSASFLGNVIHYQLQFGDRVLQVESNPDTIFAVGDELFATFDVRHAVAVPPAS
jgi:iron(III) transport system ATP-binding protein